MKKSWLTTAIVLAGTSLAAESAWTMEIAKVNGRPIRSEDLKSVLNGLNEAQRVEALKDGNTKRQILMNLIDQEVLVQQGEKDRLDQSADYKAAVALFRRQYLSMKTLERNLASKLNEKAAKSYYARNKSKFSTDQVHVMHILAETEDKARELIKRANARDADFQALAEQYSRDPSAKNNRGDLGFITYDSPFVKEFKEAAFNTPAGKVRGPVKTAYGYHVIKVIEKKFGKPLNYDEVELRVKEELKADLVESYVASLKAKAKVSVDDKALDKL